ncbi:MAG: AAA family ATPase, partial [Pricia sp.]
MATLTDASFYTILKDKFPHEPTLKQSVALQKLSGYILNKDANRVFLLKGFAGTGKTTLVGTLVNSLWKTTYKSVLMAPTGRATKVMSNYANTQA